MELDLDFLKSLISDFDLMALLPDLAEMMAHIVEFMSWTVVFGPMVLAFMGLWYLILPAREANHMLGYRFFWGMGSVKSWKFTQRFAGLVWAIVGLVMAYDGYNIRPDLMAMETLDMLYRIIEILLDQIVVVVISCLAINVFIFILFNFKGNIRKIWISLANWIKGLINKAKENKAEKPKRERNSNPQQ